jgi:hypothetical protein
VIYNATVPFCGGMQPVRLIESRIPCNPFQKERNQRNRVFSSDFRINPCESLYIFRTQIGKHFHATKQHLDITLFNNGNDPVEVFFQKVRIDPPQAVISAGFKNDDLRFQAEMTQRMRDKVPLLVSPLIPALTTLT